MFLPVYEMSVDAVILGFLALEASTAEQPVEDAVVLPSSCRRFAAGR